MKTKSLSQKLILCLLAGLVCGETFRRVGAKFLSALVPIPIIIVISVAILLGALIGGLVWYNREKKVLVDGERTTAFWVGALRYGIAFDLALFAFQKIFHQQFVVPLGMLDEPFNDLSKRWLMWAFFGRSQEFIVTIAVSQIIGASLLVFNRTRLLGVIVLIPIMLNIVLIDIFYDLEYGVLVHALFLLAGLIQLLLLDYTRLTEFFFKDRSIEHLSVPTKNVFAKYAGRLSIIIIPLLLIVTYPSPDKHPDLTGKYLVSDMKVNGKPAAVTNDADSLLTVVYFDLSNDCVFEFNSLKRRMFGLYQLDNEGAFSAAWHYPPAAKDRGFAGVLTKQGNSEVELNGVMNGDSIQVLLQKQ
jgi:hypothetical protein